MAGLARSRPHRSIRRSVVVPVENNHYSRRKSVNHRRNSHDGGHSSEQRKDARREKRGREQAEAAEERNQTSSTRLPRVIAGRPLHATKIASRPAAWCLGVVLVRPPVTRCRPLGCTPAASQGKVARSRTGDFVFSMSAMVRCISWGLIAHCPRRSRSGTESSTARQPASPRVRPLTAWTNLGSCGFVRRSARPGDRDRADQ